MEREEENVVPTDEPAINYQGVKAMPFIIGNEAFEKLGTIGISSNLAVYLTSVFDMKNVTAATLVYIIGGTTNMAPLIGAFLSDSYFGRYKTLAFASISSLLGMTGLMLTAAISKLHPPHSAAHNTGPTPWQLAFLLAGFSLQAIGAGGIRPCSLAFGADQFDSATKSGKRGIRSFFNWYYFTFTFAIIISVTFIIYVQSKISWVIGFLIPTCLMFIGCALFFLGSRYYVKVKPEGSPLVSVAQVMVAATKKRRSKVPDNMQFNLFNYIPSTFNTSKLPRTDQFRFLDKAAIVTSEDQITSNGSAANPWKLCSVQQVEELKCIARILPIWTSAIIAHTAIIQQQTFLVFQALQSDRRLGRSSFVVPAASYAVFPMLTLAMWIPIYDKVVVPSLRKLTGKEGGITLLQRIGIGIVFSILSVLVSGLVEERRRNLALTMPTLGIAPKGGTISSMSALWLVPQLALAGMFEAFNIIGQIEFYYKEFPENMSSIAGSFFFSGVACSSYLSGFLISAVHRISLRARTGDWLPEDLNKGRLDYFYYLIAAPGVLNLGYFLVCAKWYRYKGSGGNTPHEVASQTNQSENHFV